MKADMKTSPSEVSPLSKAQKKILRSSIFRHLDGIAVAPTAYALHQQGVLDYIISNKSVSLAQVCEAFNANEGYMNVALRLMCSQDWLIQKVDNSTNEVDFNVNSKSEFAFGHLPLLSGGAIS